MRGARLFAVMAIAGAVGAGVYQSRTAQANGGDVPPTAEFLAAGLRQQELQLPGSLEMSYSMTFSKSAGGQLVEKVDRDYRYLRTPDAQRVECAASNKQRASYDIATGEGRSLSEVEPGKLRGSVGGRPHLLSVRELLETTRYPLYEGALVERVAYGTVDPEAQVVDGHACWKVDIPTSYPNLQKYVAYLDPSIGCNPRKIVFVWTDTAVPTTVRYEDYRAYGAIWFPMKQTITYGSSEDESLAYSIVNAVKEINVGRPVVKSEVLVQFPSGTRVNTGDMVFTVP